MGVYIKDMEMPKSCPCELLGIGYDVWCSFAGGIPARVKEFYECCQNGTRPSWCPLVPVPPHGDLIDRDPFIDFIKTHWDSYDQWFIGQLEARPTIIPAEEDTDFYTKGHLHLGYAEEGET